MSKLTGAQALVAALAAHGARYVFGIPGVHTLPLYDALGDYPTLSPIVTRHESGATFAADGYARVSGAPGVVSVVPGPGALNAANGVLCAWSDRVPMIVLAVELDSSPRRGRVHECDLEAAYRPFTRAQLRIMTRADVERVVEEAFWLATRAPAGPVQVLIPQHILAARGTSGAGQAERAGAPAPDDAALAELATFVQDAHAPTVILGQGVARAASDALRLVERLGAPAFTDVAARGLIPEDHPLAAGLPSWPHAAEVLAASDATLVLGSRLSEITTLNWAVRLPQKLARVDADAAELQGNYPATLAMQADPALMLPDLVAMLGRSEPSPASAALRALTTARHRRPPEQPSSANGRIHPRAAVQELRAALPRQAIVTSDGTATEFWLSEQSFPVLAPAGFIVPEVQQTMGYGLAAAVGAALGAPQRPVVCISGDGSVQMTLGELATAAGLGRQLTVVIFEDGFYNALRIYQDGLYGRQTGVRLRNPDFEILGRAYGAYVERVEAIDALRAALHRALAAPGLSLLAVAIDPLPLPDRYARRLQQMAPPRAV